MIVYKDLMINNDELRKKKFQLTKKIKCVRCSNTSIHNINHFTCDECTKILFKKNLNNINCENISFVNTEYCFACGEISTYQFHYCKKCYDNILKQEKCKKCHKHFNLYNVIKFKNTYICFSCYKKICKKQKIDPNAYITDNFNYDYCLECNNKFHISELNYIFNDCYCNNCINKLNNNKADNDHKYITKYGFYTRSKSEKIIADWLYDNKIKVLYEFPIYFKEIDKELHPDFFLFEKNTIYEHFGIDNYNYLKQNFEKSKMYIRNKFNFFFTTENEIENIGKILDKYFNSKENTE